MDLATQEPLANAATRGLYLDILSWPDPRVLSQEPANTFTLSLHGQGPTDVTGGGEGFAVITEGWRTTGLRVFQYTGDSGRAGFGADLRGWRAFFLVPLFFFLNKHSSDGLEGWWAHDDSLVLGGGGYVHDEHPPPPPPPPPRFAPSIWSGSKGGVASSSWNKWHNPLGRGQLDRRDLRRRFVVKLPDMESLSPAGTARVSPCSTTRSFHGAACRTVTPVPATVSGAAPRRGVDGHLSRVCEFSPTEKTFMVGAEYPRSDLKQKHVQQAECLQPSCVAGPAELLHRV